MLFSLTCSVTVGREGDCRNFFERWPCGQPFHDLLATTLGNGWPFGKYARKTGNGQHLLLALGLLLSFTSFTVYNLSTLLAVF